jgi:hypothetical protein
MIKHKTPGIEKRQYPRVIQELPIRVVANGYDFITTTQNISCIGAYCNIAKYIPPFTKIRVRLDLPMFGDEGLSAENSIVECTGVVVRTEDTPNGTFNIAVFFNKIHDGQRNKISQYLNQFLAQDAAARP